MDGVMDGWYDGWMDGWIGGWSSIMDGWGYFVIVVVLVAV